MHKRFIIKSLVFINCSAIAILAKQLYIRYDYPLLSHISTFLPAVLFIWLLAEVIYFIVQYKLYKGLRYALTHYSVKKQLKKQLIDAGIYIDRCDYIELPKITLNFNKTLSEGVLKLKNSVTLHDKLNIATLSPALHKYTVETHYLTDDKNYHVYTLVDADKDFKLTFESFNEYVEYCEKFSDYVIFLDARSSVKLQSMLLVGMTGSGKTTTMHHMLLQFYAKKISYELYYADPKGSSLAVIGQIVSPERTAINFDDIVKLLEVFVAKMQVRKEEIKTMLYSKIDADYSDFEKSPYIFIFEEYASFSATLAGKEKKIRDKVNDLLMEIVLQGRQLGFFFICIMQKSGADLINTSLRDNLPLKIVLGNSEQQTYVTAFGNGVRIPERHYKVGEGVFTEPRIAPQPKLIQCPYLKFDILDAIKTANSHDVITGVAELNSAFK